MTEKLTLVSPFDAHVHWRTRETLMGAVAPYTINQFAGCLVMPNTNKPNILSKKEMKWYREQVKETVGGEHFLTLMSYFLSPSLKKEDFEFIRSEKFIQDHIGFAGVKYYPKGGTTNSSKGMKGFNEVKHVLKMMEKYEIPLLIHGEIALNHQNELIDDFDRESVFLNNEMKALRRDFPELPIVLEHITTKEAGNFVMEHKNICATITPQHLLFDRRALFNGVTTLENTFKYDPDKNGMHPAVMCRPILKPTKDVEALRHLLKVQHNSGLQKFGLGTDTAPHTKEKKYCECGACGVFTAPIALELYAMAFEEMGILDHLQTFACEIMPDFYGVKDKLPFKEVVLNKQPKRVEEHYHNIVTPFAGQNIPWAVK